MWCCLEMAGPEVSLRVGALPSRDSTEWRLCSASEGHHGRVASCEVRDTLGHSAARMRTYYDRKADDDVYKPGDVVWYYYPRVKR